MCQCETNCKYVMLHSLGNHTFWLLCVVKFLRVLIKTGKTRFVKQNECPSAASHYTVSESKPDIQSLLAAIAEKFCQEFELPEQDNKRNATDDPKIVYADHVFFRFIDSFFLRYSTNGTMTSGDDHNILNDVFFLPAGDEHHKSLTWMLTGPGNTALWVCLSWQSPWPHPIPRTNLHKLFQRGSALVTGL